MLLKNKNILVTGSTAGIGFGIVKQALSEGANVMVHGQNPDKLKEARHQLEVEGFGEQVAVHGCDLTKPEAAEELVEACVTELGSLDGLVNNAGVFPRNDVETVTAEDFDWIVAVNMRAPMLLAQAAVRHWRTRSYPGTIVNIGSINAHCGQPNLLAYSMSKGGLQTMTRNLGDALGPEKIRVNQLNVGWTYTEMEHQTQLSEGRPEDWLSQVPSAFAPSGTLLVPENIANHVVFWLSERSAPVNGSVYEVEQYPLIGRNKIAES
ncbi:SDR family NAD(P)-dependent oxidoreductase [Aestuariispira insulae]|uniref:NAD(P)-dependent dehydrogenase (Short-subunit alcohol dehydrogenase family) n=1 Tax=Aestuariispira insulae TaxID=1461337 RepID=A0A3D9HMS2_9PROT|nr:SDR family NAD(P)-dependent oxidoreductase [Aestuariispira insulae]RED50807.1 NAD(P)-dependent dehydrogenase (short-subunit alcohol dehydrogenase family) [Aestuariispira insulae]